MELVVEFGSMTCVGRYYNLSGVFGMSGVSGVGISFGADRIFDVLNQLELYPKEAVNGTEVLFINFGEKEAAFSMGILSKVRAAGIRAEIFPDAAKMKKQMSYANAKNIPFVAFVGENEINDGKAMLNCSFPKSIILPLFTLCVLNTAFAYIVQTRAQKTIDASKVSLVLSFESTLGAVFAVILGGDKFTWYLALSIIGMTAAILIAEWPTKKQKSSLPDVETNNYDFSSIQSLSDDEIILP